jgi:hypothetical protein
VFELSASLYSVALGHGVGVIDMTYSGPSVKDALGKFADKLAAAVPNARCAGWRHDPVVDADQIREMIDR